MHAASGRGAAYNGSGGRAVVVSLDRRTFTADELERMVEAGSIGADERVEPLAGEIVRMSPIGPRHEA